MIPLVRPNMPEPAEWLDLYGQALEAGQLSNYGRIWEQAGALLAAATSAPAIPVANGTLALQVAIAATIPPYARVAVPDFTFAATAHAVVGAGCEPVFVDCTDQTMQPNPLTLMQHHDSFDAFVVVSAFGYTVDFAFWDQLSTDLGKPVVYDLAGAWGMPIGTHNPCTMSFHATKTMPIGEGGAIFCSSKEQLERCRAQCNFGLNVDRVSQSARATNAKMDELHAAVLCAQLMRKKKIDARIRRRRELVVSYAEALPELLSFEVEWLYGSTFNRPSAPSLCALEVLNGDAGRIVDALAKESIVARRGYYPLLPDHPAFEECEQMGQSGHRLRNIVCLPSDVTDEEQDTVLRIISGC